MRLTLLAIGSRGDVQPMVALGRALSSAGYQIRLASFGNFRTFVEGAGLEFSAIAGGSEQLIDSSEGRAMVEAGGNVIKQVRAVRAISRKLIAIPGYWESYEKACLRADGIIYRDSTPHGFHLAEKLRIPAIIAATTPTLTPTGALPSPLWPVDPGLGRVFNHMTHSICLQFMWQPFRTMINDWRRNHLALPELSFRGPYPDIRRGQILYAFSPSVVPRAPEWGNNVHVTGYWFLDLPRNWMPDPALLNFLNAGPPPVYIGFGSAANAVTSDVEFISQALRFAGCRGLVSVPSQKGAELVSEGLMLIGETPFDWLFPRTSAVVHHGGSGTTACGLRAGVPNVLIPCFSDQPYWSRCVAGLQAGPAPLSSKNLTPERLGAAIATAVSDAKMRRNAARLGEKIRAENGLQTSVEIIDRCLRAKSTAIAQRTMAQGPAALPAASGRYDREPERERPAPQSPD